MTTSTLDQSHDLTEEFLTADPRRVIHASDTVGGDWTPNLTRRQDPCAKITSALRSNWAGVVPIDTFGREGVSSYLISEAVRIQREDGIPFVDKEVHIHNGAERLGGDEEDCADDGNGSEYYAFREGSILIIAQLGSFKGIRETVLNNRNSLHRLVNIPRHQQFRTSVVQEHVRDGNNLVPDPDAADRIPKLIGVEIGVFDRFGNGRFESNIPDLQQKLIDVTNGGEILLPTTINGVDKESPVSFDGDLKNLDRTREDQLAFYFDKGRGGRFSITWPWPPSLKGLSKAERTRRKILNSAFFGHIKKHGSSNEDAWDFPEEGTPIKIHGIET